MVWCSDLKGFGLRAWGLWLRAVGFQAWGFAFQAQGLEFRVWLRVGWYRSGFDSFGGGEGLSAKKSKLKPHIFQSFCRQYPEQVGT